MILDELTRTYPLENDELEAAKNYFTANPRGDKHQFETEFFERLGWEQTGSGRMSDVYINSSKPYALKINRKYDRQFAWFVLITKKFPNPHFPHIGNMKLVKIGKYKYYIYLMEKLEDCHDIDVPINTRVFNTIIEHPDINPDTFFIKTATYFKQNPLLYKALQTIGEHNPHKYGADITANNVMKRADGTIVITDPLGD